jgi:HK97 family phage portal protein
VTPLVVSPFHPVARITEPDEPGRDAGRGYQEAAAEFFLWEAGFSEELSETRVNAFTAMTYSAFWACVRILSATIASLGWHQYERSADGKSKLPVDDDVSWMINVQANPEMTAFDWRQVALKDALTGGDHYSEIERNGAGRPLAMWRISPDRCAMDRLGNGRLALVVDNGPGERESVLPYENVFHVKGMSPDGIVGYDMVAMAERYIRLGLDISEFGTSFFARGPTPGGILTMPGHVKQEERAAVRKSFEKTYGGSKNAGRVVALSAGMDFKPLTQANSDAQLTESGVSVVLDICRFFGVPPHLVAELSRATFSNIEHQAIEFVQNCLLPWCRRLETEAQVKLYNRAQAKRRYTRVNLASLLRGDSRTQVENVVKQVTSGLLMLDEGRELFEYNPLPDGLGQTPIVQGAMAPLERILEEPAPAPARPAPPPPDEEEDDEGEDVPERLVATFTPLLADAYGRLLRVEADKARRAHNKGKLNYHVAGYYTPDCKEHVAKTIKPILEALLLATGREPGIAGNLAANLAEDHARKSVNDLAQGLDAVAAWEGDGRAARQAASHLSRVWESIQ